MCVTEAKRFGKRVAAHARSCESVKQCIRHGIEVIYHASFADEEALDLLEANKDKHFVAPGLAWLINTSYHASAMGTHARGDEEDGLPPRTRDRGRDAAGKMLKRGIRILPGGDYGFAWTPHGTNAKDLEYFVQYLGMSPMEALLSATAWGGQMMQLGDQLGVVRDGALADLLLVDGDPLADITHPAGPEPHSRGDEGRRVPSRANGALGRRADPLEPRRHRRHDMGDVLFTNVRIIDGSGAGAVHR